jgi:O-antigen/teichoic acid export membrane protein
MIAVVRRLTKNAFAREAGVQTAASGLVAVVIAVQGIMTARWLGPSAYGVVALVSAFPALILTFLSPDSQHATIRFLAARDAERDRVGAVAAYKVSFLADLVMSLATFGLLAAGAWWAEEHIVGVDGAAGLLLVAGLGVVVSAPTKTATSILVHARRFGVLSVAQVATAVIRSGLIAVLVVAGHGVAGAVWGSTIGLAVKNVVLTVIAAAEAKGRWGIPWRSARLSQHRGLRSEMIRYLVWTDLASLFKAIPSQLDVVVLGWLVGVREVGHYRLAKSVSILPYYIVSPLQSVIVPRLARIAAEGTRGLMKVALRRQAMLSAALAVGCVGGLVVMPLALQAAAGSGYGPTVTICRILVVAAAIPTVFYWLRPLYMATGQVRRWAVGEAGSAAVGLLLYLPATRWWGAIGMASVQVLIAAGRNGSALARVTSILRELPASRVQPAASEHRPETSAPAFARR